MIEAHHEAYRLTESPIEQMVYDYLLGIGCRPGARWPGPYAYLFPQYPVGHYRADFAIKVMNADKFIAIECDGKAFHSSDAQKAYDAKRDEVFRSLGFEVHRLSGSQIYRNVREAMRPVVTRIVELGAADVEPEYDDASAWRKKMRAAWM